MENAVSDAIIEMSNRIAMVPEPWRSDLRKLHLTLTDSVLSMIATIMERDKAVLALVDQTKSDTSYIAFDLEATRRERADLQARLSNVLGLDDDPGLQE